MTAVKEATTRPAQGKAEAFPLDTRLSDGTLLRIRPVQAEDKPMFEAGMAQLSDKSRQARFMHAVSHLSGASLRLFTEIDHWNHEAIGAFEPRKDAITGLDGVPVGVVRYIRDPERKTAAEVAVTVIDKYHSKGVGTLLLAILAWRAVANGVREFTAVVQADNRGMLGLFSELGGSFRNEDPGIVGVRIPLYADADLYPPTPAGDMVRKTWAMLEPA